MDCSSCAATVEKALRQLDGVQEIRVDIVAEKVTVSYLAETLAPEDLTITVKRAGYPVEEIRTSEETVGTARTTAGSEVKIGGLWERHSRLILAAVAGVFWLSSLVAKHVLDHTVLAAGFAIAAMVSAGWYIVPRGIRAAMNRALDMNFLMSIAAVGAFIIGEYEEAASALMLFAVAQLLEARSMDRARNAIRALMDLSPTEAVVLQDGVERRVPADRVAAGAVVIVRPGEKIPVDGVILRGRSTVNQAPITGESLPVEKEEGVDVFAGTLNGEGALEIRSTRPGSDTTLARIIHSVEEAQATRAPSQAFVDRFARVYTPAVVVIAALLFVVPPLTGLGGWGEWFYRALVLLVVACPCALVISTPVTVVSALAGAAREGILIKGGLHLENAGRARVLAIDKTGTLTAAEPDVIDIVPLDGTDPRELLRLAAMAEARSEHPLAAAILRRAEQDKVDVPAAADVTALPGRGIRADSGSTRVYAGSPRLFRELGVLTALAEGIVDRETAKGHTMVLVGVAEKDDKRPRVLGLITIADRVRPHAAAALRALHSAGVQKIVMLTGDNAAAARTVADALGPHTIDEIRAGLLPEDKVAAVRELRASNGGVVMVGDGVNDAPALAAADVGVAMGTAGSDVALETADIALMSDDLAKLATTIHIARKAERIIRTNIVFALLSKAAFMVLAIAGVATLWMAVLADMGASLLVTLNGMRALRANR